ncbi:MAG: hypothetical protein RIG62_03655 [Cyclobacteriaceae bacterium]
MQKKTDTIKQTTQRRQAHQSANNATQITPMQRELLDMFAHKELSSQEISELKDILSDYFLNKAQDELETLAQDEGWDLEKKADQWGKEKLRTPYRRDRSS